jgi:hypothetical protein
VARTFRTPGLDTWEAFASTAEGGYSAPARIVFRCISRRSETPRFAEFPGDTSDAEQAIGSLTDEELRGLFEGSLPLD